MRAAIPKEIPHRALRDHHNSTLKSRLLKKFKCGAQNHTPEDLNWDFSIIAGFAAVWDQCWSQIRGWRRYLPFRLFTSILFLPTSFFSMYIENGSGFLVKNWVLLCSETNLRLFHEFLGVGVCVCVHLKSAGPSFWLSEVVPVTQKYESLVLVIPNSEIQHLNFDLLQPTWLTKSLIPAGPPYLNWKFSPSLSSKTFVKSIKSKFFKGELINHHGFDEKTFLIGPNHVCFFSLPSACIHLLFVLRLKVI